MTRFLIGTVPLTGHVRPALPLARKLVERGHDVLWYAGRKFRNEITATGAQFVPMGDRVDFDDSDPEAAFPMLRGRNPFTRLKAQLVNFFINSLPDQYTELQSILQTFPADVLLGDISCGGIALVGNKRNLPWATLNVTPLSYPSRDTAPPGIGILPSSSPLGRLRNMLLNRVVLHMLFHDLNDQYRQICNNVGVRPAATYFHAISPFLYLQPTVPAFEYPRSDLPPQVHFIGALLPTSPPTFIPPSWWPDVQKEQPVVLVTQGTLTTNPTNLVVPTIQALAEQDVLIVATVANRSANAVPLSTIPTNARITPFIDFAQLMPHVNVMITNGGYGGVHTALAHGVPLIVAGTTEEKPEVAAHVAWAGVGINLRTNTPSPEQIKQAVAKILGNPTFHKKAQQIQADLARHDAPTEAAQLLEQLAETRQPILTQPVRHRQSTHGSLVPH
jgi:MGT family glycosyltransferase